MQNLTVIIPYYNGQKTIARLVSSIPSSIPILIVDDYGENPVPSTVAQLPNVKVTRAPHKGYFTGACNWGMKQCDTDVLILNQDANLIGDEWQKAIISNRKDYALIGERIAGNHPAWADGYIHGTFMFIRRDAIAKVGLMNDEFYPLWGSTCEYQLRLARAGYKALALRPMPGLEHERPGRFGEAITDVLHKEPDKKSLFIRTPPEISVIVPCFNHGKYLPDLVHSLIGGKTSLGEFPPQTFQSFEIVIVNDCSTDDTVEWCKKVADPSKGIRCIRTERNVGTGQAINAGVKASFGKYITILGGDDMREPWSLEALYRACLANPHSFVYDGIMPFAAGNRRQDIAIGVRQFDPVTIFDKNHVHAGIMFPRQAWDECGGYPDMPNGREDWAMNVNLTVHGYCGILIPGRPGYLYRREKQNRTLTNTTKADWRLFYARIQQLFPEYYDGRRDRAMCCGQGARQKVSGAVNRSKSSAIVPGGEGLVTLEYIGHSAGTQSFYGWVTGARYVAGLSQKYIAVDPRDLSSGKSNKPGLLEMRDNGRAVFHVYSQPKAAVKEAAPAPAPVNVIEAETGMKDEPEVVAELEKISNDELATAAEAEIITAEQPKPRRGRKAKTQ